jgi:Ca2+-transporting ATPase
MLSETTQIETPLTRQLAAVGKWLTTAIASVAVLLFVVGLLRGYPFVDATLASITLAVAAIPEGLPAIITIALAIGVQRMAHRQAVIRRLPAVETLGSTMVICTDKTGTLTRNEMTVQELWTAATASYAVSGVGYAPEGELSRDGQRIGSLPADVRELLLAGALCNDAVLHRDGDAWRIAGDPTEGALIVAAQKLGMDAQKERRSRPRRDGISFESERQYMATLHEEPGGGQIIFVKGAPEVVVRRCKIQVDGGPVDPKHALAQADQMAARGMRILAFAARRPEAPHSELRQKPLGRLILWRHRPVSALLP